MPELVENAGYELSGRYLSGDTLRLYRENDGYYDLDLITGEETFLAPAQLEDARSAILLPNCAMEINDDQIRLFDGESWRNVELPEQLQDASVSVEAVASDRIFLMGYEYLKYQLYQIMLGEEDLVLEYCGEIN